MKELVCIVCPRGCHLHVDEDNDFKVTGNSCPKGAAYGREEMINPCRVVTSTVKVKGEGLRRCPVKTDKAIPKKDIFKAMELLDKVELVPPVHRGDVVVEPVLDSGAVFVACRDITEE